MIDRRLAWFCINKSPKSKAQKLFKWKSHTHTHTHTYTSYENGKLGVWFSFSICVCVEKVYLKTNWKLLATVRFCCSSCCQPTVPPTPPSSYKSSATRFWPELRKTMLVLFRSVVYLKSNLFVFLLATQTASKSAFLLWPSINAFITYYFYLLFQSISVAVAVAVGLFHKILYLLVFPKNQKFSQLSN